MAVDDRWGEDGVEEEEGVVDVDDNAVLNMIVCWRGRHNMSGNVSVTSRSMVGRLNRQGALRLQTINALMNLSQINFP